MEKKVRDWPLWFQWVIKKELHSQNSVSFDTALDCTILDLIMLSNFSTISSRLGHLFWNSVDKQDYSSARRVYLSKTGLIPAKIGDKVYVHGAGYCRIKKCVYDLNMPLNIGRAFVVDLDGAVVNVFSSKPSKSMIIQQIDIQSIIK